MGSQQLEFQPLPAAAAPQRLRNTSRTGLRGAYAEYALPADFPPKPAGLGWETAAALPVAVETSDRVLGELAVGPGETLLIHGAASVVGSVGVQLAVARGATVIGTASESNHHYLRSLGAIPVAYGDGLADRVRAVAPQGVDAVYDVAGIDALGPPLSAPGPPSKPRSPATTPSADRAAKPSRRLPGRPGAWAGNSPIRWPSPCGTRRCG